MNYLAIMDNLKNSIIIPAVICVFGAFLGGIVATRLINKTTEKVTQRNIDEQNKVIEESKHIQALAEIKLIRVKSRIVYNDILNACHEGFMYLKSKNQPTLISINYNYSEDVMFLYNRFTQEELTLIYNIYGMLEKIRHDILKSDYSTGRFLDVQFDFSMLVNTIFKDKYEKIINFTPTHITKDFLLDNMNSEYKIIFTKLNNSYLDITSNSLKSHTT